MGFHRTAEALVATTATGVYLAVRPADVPAGRPAKVFAQIEALAASTTVKKIRIRDITDAAVFKALIDEDGPGLDGATANDFLAAAELDVGPNQTITVSVLNSSGGNLTFQLVTQWRQARQEYGTAGAPREPMTV